MRNISYVKNPDILLADAMAASAAYPGLVGPFTLDTRKYIWYKYEGKTQNQTRPKFKKLHLWDGGLYENLGVEPIFKIGEKHKYHDDCNFLVVSDASNPIGSKKYTGQFWKRAIRLIDISMDQVRSLRTRTLINHFENNNNSGVYLKIGNTGRKILEAVETNIDMIAHLTENSLSLKDAHFAENFETTLRKLSVDEYDLLYQHGWEVANFTLQARCPNLFQNMFWKSTS